MKQLSRTLSFVRPLSAALLVAAALAAPAAQAQPAAAASSASQRGQGHRHGGMGAWLNAIGATPAQKANIKAILASARTQVQAAHAAAGNPRLALAQALAADPVNVTAAQTAQANVVALQSTVSGIMLQAKLQIAQTVLSPAQRAQLLALMQARAAKWQQHHGA